MELFPAIDILDNKVVRLSKGDYNASTEYHESPLEQAHEFARQGAKWLHIVDLEGARSGTPTQQATIAAIVKDTGLCVEVGGGIRCLEHIESLKQAGVSRVVLGTSLVTNPDFADEALKRYGSLICAGVDARNNEIAIAGWLEGSGQSAEDFIATLKQRGAAHLVYTDINRDGMQTGIDAGAYEHIARCAGFPVTASGGIASLSDIHHLAALGDTVIEAIIVGRALYEGAFTVTEALTVLEEHAN